MKKIHTRYSVCKLFCDFYTPQNAPMRFQVVLVATDPSADESEVNIDIARQFAREKQLQLVECDVDKLPHTERTFAAIVEKIMESWDGETAIGWFPHPTYTHQHTHTITKNCFSVSDSTPT